MFLSREEALLFSFRRKLKVKWESQVTKTKCHVEMTLVVQLPGNSFQYLLLNPNLPHSTLLMTERTIITLTWTTARENTNPAIKIILDEITAIYSQ